MKKIGIEVSEGKMAKWVNGVLTLIDERSKNVMERIKTFEDACMELGDNHPFVKEYDSISVGSKDIIAYLKLRIIVAALNEGWEPKFTEDEYRYFPCFYLYTQKEIDEMSEEDKDRAVCRSGSSASASGGVAVAHTDYASAYMIASIGSRIAFKTRELAEYAGKQFTEIYADLNFKPE